MRGTSFCIVMVLLMSSVPILFVDTAATTVPVPTKGAGVNWQEYVWGDFKSRPTQNGVAVSGSYTGVDLIPNGGGFNGWTLKSQEYFSASVELSADITISSLVGDEVFVCIGIRGPNPDNYTRGDILEWGPYYYASAGWNFMGYRNKWISSNLDRQFPDVTNIVVGSTHRYKMLVGVGNVSYFIDGVLKYTESLPFESFSLQMHASAKYPGTSVSVAYDNISVMGGFPGGLTPHGPIDINGNAGFTAQNGVVSGSGTPSDPYVISGWEIANSYLAIRISNTNVWFVIKDVFVHGGTGGIYFYSVQNGAIDNSTMTGFAHAGIAVWSSLNINILKSKTLNNGHEGIIFRDSSSLNLTGNRVSSNLWQGIVLERCTMSWVIDNVIESNVHEKDTAGYPHQAGIVLFSCSGVDVYHNDINQTAQTSAYDDSIGCNAWDSGYPMGGNYWSSYNGSDIHSGPEQLRSGPDGIGDSPFVIYANIEDRYPFILSSGWTVQYVSTSFQISMLPGWNLISNPLLNYSLSARSLMLLTGSMVVGWDAPTQSFAEVYLVGLSPPSHDFPIEIGHSYFVWSLSEQTITLNGYSSESFSQYTLDLDVPQGGGWVFAGFSTLGHGPNASDVSSMALGARVLIVCKWNPGIGYQAYLGGISPPRSDFVIGPGVGCALWADGPGTLTYSP